jgi:hypothetical protein
LGHDRGLPRRDARVQAGQVVKRSLGG